jgi:hypothetical protein
MNVISYAVVASPRVHLTEKDGQQPDRALCAFSVTSKPRSNLINASPFAPPPKKALKSRVLPELSASGCGAQSLNTNTPEFRQVRFFNQELEPARLTITDSFFKADKLNRQRKSGGPHYSVTQHLEPLPGIRFTLQTEINEAECMRFCIGFEEPRLPDRKTITQIA